MDSHDALTIGALAERCGVGVETVRYYQRRGLLRAPPKPSGSIRRYGSADVQRLHFVRAAQRLGFSLDDIALLLRLDDGAQCQRAQRIATVHLAQVRQRLAHLRRIERALAALVARCDSAGARVRCPLIDSLRLD